MPPDRVAVVRGAEYAAAGHDIAGWRPGILRRHAGTAELINCYHSLKPSGAVRWTPGLPGNSDHTLEQSWHERLKSRNPANTQRCQSGNLIRAGQYSSGDSCLWREATPIATNVGAS